MIATGLAAGCAHAAALMCDEDLPQEAAGQLSDDEDDGDDPPSVVSKRFDRFSHLGSYWTA